MWKHLILLFFCLSVSMKAWSQTTSEQLLESEVEKNQLPSDYLNKADILPLINAVANVIKATPAQKCEEVKYINNSYKYKTSYDASGRPCRVYDLSFPTIKSVIQAALPIASIPLQKFTVEDYLAWFRGDYDRIQNEINRYNANYENEDIFNSWYFKLPLDIRGHDPSKTRGSFRLSDVENIYKFQFTDAQKVELRKLFTSNSRADQAMLDIIEDTSNLTRKIKFNWNDAKKAFDIILEFDFLPLAGPVPLIDYNAQHKLVVEKMTRAALLKAFKYIVGYIPNETAKRFTSLALEEVFSFVDLAYEYQLNQLEDTLNKNIDKTILTSIPKADLQKAQNILFVNKTSLLMEYVMGMATGSPLNLDELDKIGKKSKYNIEKQREITFANLHSNLVLKKGCQMEIENKYFGICNKDDQAKELYSLISSTKILFWDFGATKLHDYNFASKTLLKRSTSYLAAMSLRMFDIPIVPSVIEQKLVDILRYVTVVGMQDEAYLLNHYSELKYSNNQTTMWGDYHINWLYKQKFNPFLTHSEAMEQRLIMVNEKYFQK